MLYTDTNIQKLLGFKITELQPYAQNQQMLRI